LAWTIEYAETAIRQLRKMEHADARRIADFLDERVAAGGDPRRLGKALKGPLGELWSYRLGDFRVLCDLRDSVLTVLVLQIGNRKEVYR
jgi:mRNA interferase RelE/StbE